MSSNECLKREQLDEFLAGRVSPEEWSARELHLSQCRICRQTLVSLHETAQIEAEAMALPSRLRERAVKIPMKGRVLFMSWPWLTVYRTIAVAAGVLVVSLSYITLRQMGLYRSVPERAAESVPHGVVHQEAQAPRILTPPEPTPATPLAAGQTPTESPMTYQAQNATSVTESANRLGASSGITSTPGKMDADAPGLSGPMRKDRQTALTEELRTKQESKELIKTAEKPIPFSPPSPPAGVAGRLSDAAGQKLSQQAPAEANLDKQSSLSVGGAIVGKETTSGQPRPSLTAPPPDEARRAAQPSSFYRDFERKDDADSAGARAVRSSALKLAVPRANAVLTGNSLEFRWGPVAFAELYTFNLLDDKGETIFKSNTTTPYLSLRGQSIPVERGRSYSWFVRAALTDGTLIESEKSKLSIKPE